MTSQFAIAGNKLRNRWGNPKNVGLIYWKTQVQPISCIARYAFTKKAERRRKCAEQPVAVTDQCERLRVRMWNSAWVKKACLILINSGTTECVISWLCMRYDFVCSITESFRGLQMHWTPDAHISFPEFSEWSRLGERVVDLDLDSIGLSGFHHVIPPLPVRQGGGFS